MEGSWRGLGGSWRGLGEVLEGSWGGLGGVLGGSWGVLGGSWGVLGGLGLILAPRAKKVRSTSVRSPPLGLQVGGQNRLKFNKVEIKIALIF